MSTIDAQDKAENETVEEEVNQTSTPDVEPKAPEEVEEPEEESTEESEEEAPETEKKVQKKGFENRVRELVKEKKEAQEQAKTLQERLAALTSREDKGVDPQYTPQIEPGQEISPEQYKQDVLNSARSLVELEVRKSEAINRINNEASEVVRKYPELDPESDDFNRELSDTVTEAVEAHIKANPYTASVKNFVAKLMKPYQGAVTKEVGKANEQLAKQVSSAALKPTSVSKKEKSVSEMSIKELEDKLGIMQT